MIRIFMAVRSCVQEEYDIIVVGGGLVGCSMVLAMQQQGLRIAVLEHHLPTAASVASQDSRPISLAHGSQCILQTLGIWPDLAEQACAIKTVHVSEQGRFGVTEISAQDYRLPALGYVVPFARLQHSLYQHAAKQSGVDFIVIDQLLSIHCDLTGAQIQFKDMQGEHALQAKLLIASDGTQSTCRDLLNIDSDISDHHEMALTLSATINRNHQNTAYERFTKKGAIAILPLFEANKIRLVWTLDEKLYKKINDWPDQQLQDHLQTVFGDRLGVFSELKRGHAYPLQTRIAKEQIRESFVLLGNAAHTIYPLAAQGFNLGLRDVAVLSDVLTSAQEINKHLGDITILQSYWDWRKEDQKRTQDLTGGLAKGFGLQIPGLGVMRGLGLLATDLLPPIKNRIAKRAMGLAGRLPRLVRGIHLHDGK